MRTIIMLKESTRIPPRILAAILVVALAVGLSGGCEQGNDGPPGAKTNPKLTVEFISVGQGDACIVKWKTSDRDYYALIDAGPPDMSTKVVDELKEAGCHEITVLVLTHPHTDHVGGATTVLDTFKVDEIWEPGSSNPNASSWLSLERLAQAKGIRKVDVYAGITARWGEARITVLNPFQGKVGNESNLNNTSVVLLLTLGKTDIIFGGDAETEAEVSMLDETIPDIEVLKVSHHGSSTGADPAFLEKTLPDISIISVGPNSYGHPNQSAVAALSGKGQVLGTDVVGDVEVVVTPSTYQVSTEKGVKLQEANSK